MFKNQTSRTSHSQNKKNKISQELIDLEKCTQITYDDRLFIREKIKDGDKEVRKHFSVFRKQKCLSQLQIALRKYLQINKKSKSIRGQQQSKKTAKKSSYMNSHRNSITNSIEKSNSQKIIKIDITQLRKSLEKESGSLAGNLSPRMRIPSPKMSLQLDRKKGMMNRKTSTATISARERGQVYIEQVQTLPQMEYFQRSIEKITPFEKSPKPSFLNEICESEQIDNLLRSKLSSRRNSRSSKTKPSERPDPIIKGSKLFTFEEGDKENIDHHNRIPLNFTSLYTERGTDATDPRFGQFYKKIKDIINNDKC